MKHCNICGNNIPDDTKTCEEAGFGDGCGKTMKQETKSNDEIVEEFDIDNFTHFDSGDMIVDSEGIKNYLTQTLQAKRQRCEEVVEAERRRIERFLYDNISFQKLHSTGNHGKGMKDAYKNVLDFITQPNNHK